MSADAIRNGDVSNRTEISPADIERAKGLKDIPYETINSAAAGCWMWTHSYLRANGKIQPTRWINNLVALFDDGTLVKFYGTGSDENPIKYSSDIYSIQNVIITDQASRIEVRPHHYQRTEFDQTMIGESLRTFIRYDDKQGCSVVLMASDGSMVQLIDYHHNNDVMGSNVAVEIRNTLAAIYHETSTDKPAKSADGFDL